jgi:hypothetical protein
MIEGRGSWPAAPSVLLLCDPPTSVVKSNYAPTLVRKDTQRVGKRVRWQNYGLAAAAGQWMYGFGSNFKHAKGTASFLN